MESNQENLLGLVRYLKKRNLHRPAAAMLEAINPINFLLAQLIYVGQPLLSGIFSTDEMSSLAEMLEDSNKSSALVDLLREAT